MIDKTYTGSYTPGTSIRTVTVSRDSGHRKPDERPLTHHVEHSLDGFNWGYGGSGPSELARCILWDFTGDEPPLMLYQRFKDEVISQIPMDADWFLSSAQLADWLAGRPVRIRHRTPRSGAFDTFVTPGVKG